MSKRSDSASDPDRILRIREVLNTTGLSRATLYHMVRDGTFPAPLRLNTRAVEWRRSQVQGWIADRPDASGSNWR